MRVLLLEDHADLRQMIDEYLTQRGFAIDAFARGQEALAAADVAHYDAVVLDLGLPDLDGMAVLAALRARGGHLPALIVTARDSLEDRLNGLNGGADDYIVKPFDLAELEARLRTVLRRPGPRAAVVLSFGRLAFDPTTRQAAAAGQPIDLTRRETDLLEELLRSAGRVVVKDALEDRLYAFDELGSTNAVEAAVSRLRKKLAKAGAGVWIETKRGIGYRLLVGEEP